MKRADDELPFVSIVIPAKHDEGHLAPCLSSMLQLDYPSDRYEVVVVAPSNADMRALPPSNGQVRVVVDGGRSVSGGRNIGAKGARGDIVAFTDTDCTVSTMWLRELVRAFADENVGAVAGAIVPFPPETEAQRYAARRASHSQLRPMSDPDHPFGLVANLAFRRKPLLEVGGFDPNFPCGGWEDADLCWRLTRQTGMALRYAGEAVVFHRYRSTPTAFLLQHYRYGYGLGLIYRKHRQTITWRWPTNLQAFLDVGRAAGRWATRRGVQIMAPHRRSEETTQAKFDCLRLLGQRAGFVHAVVKTSVHGRASAAMKSNAP
ncbi:MAG: glycosyltransferase [Actinomycetota bacterium]|nr:glycosyltransferase [Actinomycetota bacterium]